MFRAGFRGLTFQGCNTPLTSVTTRKTITSEIARRSIISIPKQPIVPKKYSRIIIGSATLLAGTGFGAGFTYGYGKGSHDYMKSEVRSEFDRCKEGLVYGLIGSLQTPYTFYRCFSNLQDLIQKSDNDHLKTAEEGFLSCSPETTRKKEINARHRKLCKALQKYQTNYYCEVPPYEIEIKKILTHLNTCFPLHERGVKILELMNHKNAEIVFMSYLKNLEKYPHSCNKEVLEKIRSCSYLENHFRLIEDIIQSKIESDESEELCMLLIGEENFLEAMSWIIDKSKISPGRNAYHCLFDKIVSSSKHIPKWQKEGLYSFVRYSLSIYGSYSEYANKGAEMMLKIYNEGYPPKDIDDLIDFCSVARIAENPSLNNAVLKLMHKKSLAQMKDNRGQIHDDVKYFYKMYIENLDTKYY